MVAEILSWQTAFEAFGYVMIGWAIISLFLAPFKIVDKDRRAGGWLEDRYVYHEPLLVDVSVWTTSDHDKGKGIIFRDVEPNSRISYVVELDPPVHGRASSYLEHYCGELDNVFGSLYSGNQKAKIGGRGTLELVGKEAVLRVKLDPKTVSVTARTYVTDFWIRRTPVSRAEAKRFDALLKAMTKGEAPSARKKPSDGQASDAEHDAYCSDTQTRQDISEDASR